MCLHWWYDLMPDDEIAWHPCKPERLWWEFPQMLVCSSAVQSTERWTRALTGSCDIFFFCFVLFSSDAESYFVFRGPGAGAEVTAGGVFSDLLRLAGYLGSASWEFQVTNWWMLQHERHLPKWIVATGSFTLRALERTQAIFTRGENCKRGKRDRAASAFPDLCQVESKGHVWVHLIIGMKLRMSSIPGACPILSVALLLLFLHVVERLQEVPD